MIHPLTIDLPLIHPPPDRSLHMMHSPTATYPLQYHPPLVIPLIHAFCLLCCSVPPAKKLTINHFIGRHLSSRSNKLPQTQHPSVALSPMARMSSFPLWFFLRQPFLCGPFLCSLSPVAPLWPFPLWPFPLWPFPLQTFGIIKFWRSSLCEDCYFKLWVIQRSIRKKQGLLDKIDQQAEWMLQFGHQS